MVVKRVKSFSEEVNREGGYEAEGPNQGSKSRENAKGKGGHGGVGEGNEKIEYLVGQ